MKALGFWISTGLSALLATSGVHADTSDTIYVDRGSIYTAAGERLVMRGFNEMFVWSDDKTGQRLIPEINKTGANTLRLVWDTATDKRDLIKLIETTLAHNMIAIPECHDATGKWGKALQACVDFWNDPRLIDTIQDNKAWTIVNIANEAGDHSITDDDFIASYSKAITQLRDWGYTVPIMIDAAGWGQNIDQLLRVGKTLLDHDPLHNVIFSAHSYWSTEDAIKNYYKASKEAKAKRLPMIIGEGPSVTRVGQCENPTPLPYLEGMEILHKQKTGWLNWSWGGNPNGDCDDFFYFDIVKDGKFGNFHHEPGAQIVALSPYSVMRTSERPRSFYPDGKVKASGIYLHLDKTQLKRGEKTAYSVIVAPANANSKSYSLRAHGNKGRLLIDEKNQQITAIKSGKAKLTVSMPGSKLSWTVDIDIE